MFHFYTPWKRQEPNVFWRFHGVWKCNIDVKLVNFLESKKYLLVWNAKFWHVRVSEMLNAGYFFNPLSINPTEWSKALKQFVGNLPTNCLSVFDHFVELNFIGLN